MKYIATLSTRVRKLTFEQRGMVACMVLAVLIALWLRYKLIGAQTFDYINYLKPWHDYLSAHGLHSFRYGFANYNTPYLVLLWVTTHLPIGTLVAVKGISIGFDFILAAAVGLVVSHFYPHGYRKYIAAILVLFTPTVFLNSSLWGQCDGIYTAFIMFSFYAVLKKSPNWAWILWGVAFAFKLQAIFFLPPLIFMSVYKRWKWYVPAYAALVFIVLSILPILEGRSLSSTLHIYIDQAVNPTGGQPMLSWFSPTFGQLFPTGGIDYGYFKDALLALGAAAGVGVISCGFWCKRLTDRQILLLVTLGLLIVPYLLPGIHERYLFSGEIALLTTAFIMPQYAVLAIAMQVASIITYNSYFTGANQPPQISYAILSLVVLGIIYMLGKSIATEISTKPTALAAHSFKKE